MSAWRCRAPKQRQPDARCHEPRRVASPCWASRPARMTLDVNDVIFKVSRCRDLRPRIFETWYKMAAMLQSGLDISGISLTSFPADRFAEAFEIVAGASAARSFSTGPRAHRRPARPAGVECHAPPGLSPNTPQARWSATRPPGCRQTLHRPGVECYAPTRVSQTLHLGLGRDHGVLGFAAHAARWPETSSISK